LITSEVLKITPPVHYSALGGFGENKNMRRLEALADSIRVYEGWRPNSRAWRNNNPGNLRSSPFELDKRENFSRFDTFLSGWLALYWDLFQKAQGNTRTQLNGDSSLYELFAVWAPSSDGNAPRRYAEWVGARLDVSPHIALSWFLEDLLPPR